MDRGEDVELADEVPKVGAGAGVWSDWRVKGEGSVKVGELSGREGGGC